MKDFWDKIKIVYACICAVLTVISLPVSVMFIVLKTNEIINWSWFLVLLPVIIGIGTMFMCLFIAEGDENE